MNLFLAIVQILTLIVLVITIYVSYRQARAAEKAATLSLRQVELMRAQLNATFRPVVEVTGGEHRNRDATLTLQNVGNSPALLLTAICRSGYRETLGTLSAEKARKFRFDYGFNLPLEVIDSSENRERFKLEVQSVPLRLEYTSVSGAKCWTKIDFKMGTEPPIEFQHEHGTD